MANEYARGRQQDMAIFTILCDLKIIIPVISNCIYVPIIIFRKQPLSVLQGIELSNKENNTKNMESLLLLL